MSNFLLAVQQDSVCYNYNNIEAGRGLSWRERPDALYM